MHITVIYIIYERSISFLKLFKIFEQKWLSNKDLNNIFKKFVI